MGEFVVSAGTAEKRMYWLQQLQKARREFSAGGASAVRHSVMPHQVIIYVISIWGVLFGPWGSLGVPGGP